MECFFFWEKFWLFYTFGERELIGWETTVRGLKLIIIHRKWLMIEEGFGGERVVSVHWASTSKYILLLQLVSLCSSFSMSIASPPWASTPPSATATSPNDKQSSRGSRKRWRATSTTSCRSSFQLTRSPSASSTIFTVWASESVVCLPAFTGRIETCWWRVALKRYFSLSFCRLWKGGAHLVTKSLPNSEGSFKVPIFLIFFISNNNKVKTQANSQLNKPNNQKINS